MLTSTNLFRLEPFGLGKDQSYSWVHMDVTKYNDYLQDKFFVKEQSLIIGKKVIDIAKGLNLDKLCSCGGDFKPQAAKKPIQSKYKWSHSPFGNKIAEKESGNKYNICNKTKIGKNGKREVEVITNVKVVDTKIKDIVQKQKNKDLFAVGRYQLVPKTLNAAIAALKIDVDKNLDEEMQDRIFDEYLIKIKRPTIIFRRGW